MPLVTLDEAVKPLISIVPQIEQMVSNAKKDYKNPDGHFSLDESASIMLYTLGWQPPKNSFYIFLNKTLDSENGLSLEPWFLYLKLFMTALSKLPSERRFLYRGVKVDICADYPKGKTFFWWKFSSCTSSIETLETETFLGTTGTRTLFNVDCYSGKGIRHYSSIEKEEEVLILPARQFKVVASSNLGNGLSIIQIEEIDSPYFFELLPTKSTFLPPQHTGAPGPDHTYDETLERTISKCQSQKLNLRGQQLNDQGMEIVIRKGVIEKRCMKLDLTYNQITQYGAQNLANALRHNKCLDELIISHNQISDTGVRFLAATMNSSVLKRVDLEENDISDEGVKYLTEMLTKNTSLIWLSLSHNHIGNPGVKMLASVLTSDNSCLEFLNLSANEDISDECINSLMAMMKHNRSLKELDLRHSDLSEDGEATLLVVAQPKKGFKLCLSHVM